MRPSSIRWTDWGMVWNGRCSTAKILESPNPEKGCILSDILMNDTPEGRLEIHKMLNKEAYSTALFELSQNMVPRRSIEYCDNRISRFVAVQGRCEIMGTLLSAHDVHCHHWKPTSLGGTDEYSNLRIVHKDVHKLIHASQKETIQKYLSLTGCREQNRLAKVNRWRISAGLEPIRLNELN